MPKVLLIFSALLAIGASPVRYVEGQVWTYKARPQDTGSLVKIHKIEQLPCGTVYHISVVGIHATAPTTVTFAYSVVSQQTLDASVIKQVADPGSFPHDVNIGIDGWRRDHGGVYTSTLADIVEFQDRTISGGRQPSDMSLNSLPGTCWP